MSDLNLQYPDVMYQPQQQLLSPHPLTPTKHYQMMPQGASSGSSSSSDESEDDDDEEDGSIDDDGDTEEENMEPSPSSSPIQPVQQQQQIKQEPPNTSSPNGDQPSFEQPRKATKRPSKEMSSSGLESPSPRRRQPPVKIEAELVVDNRPRLAPVSSTAPTGNRAQPPSLASRTPPQRSTPQPTLVESSAPIKKRRVTTAADGCRPTPAKPRSRTSNVVPLPLSAIHPPLEAPSCTGDDVLGLNFSSFVDSDGLSLRNVVSEMCTRASRRMRELDALRAVAEETGLTPGPPECPNKDLSEVGSTSDPTSEEVNHQHQSLVSNPTSCATVQLQLARLAEISERELRLAALQQFCFRLLRNINLCFPLWASRRGSYLWHSAFILGSTGLRDLAPYCVIFEEVWEDIQIRYAQVLRQATEQVQASKTQDGPNSDVPSFQKPKEVGGALLTSLMFQGDSIVLTNCLLQLENLRHRIDAAFEPMTEFQEVLATFTAAQTLHSTQQPPLKFLFSPMTKFRSVADLNVAMGRGGKRKAAAPSHGTPAGSSVGGAGRGRAKKGSRASPAVQTEVGTTAPQQTSVDTTGHVSRGKQVTA